MCENYRQKASDLFINKRFLIYVFVWGLLAHGTVIFQKISFWDDTLYLFGVGATFTSGRWMLGILSEIVEFFGGALQPSCIQ